MRFDVYSRQKEIPSETKPLVPFSDDPLFKPLEQQPRFESTPYIDAEIKAQIVHHCVNDLISPERLAKLYHYSVRSIQNWVKASGYNLPKTYKKPNKSSLVSSEVS